jgi:uncharacterized protein (TIGR04255 family)
MPDERKRTKAVTGDSGVDVEVFPRAPVVEAILSFRFPLLDDLQYGIPLLSGDLKDTYPHVESVDTPRGHRQGDKAFRFKSEDGKHVVRLTRNSFSFHRLRPYSEWRDLADGAQAAWLSVCRRYEPEYVHTVSLRYLNKIPLVPSTDMADYIRLCPNIPPSIDTGFSDYLLRLVLLDAGVPARAEITQIAERTELPPRTLAFDIDVITDGQEFLPTSPRLWEQVARLREYKNRLFFASITEKCRELFR